MISHNAKRSTASPARMAPIWPSCCSKKGTRCMASSAVRARSTLCGSNTCIRTSTNPTRGSPCTTGTSLTGSGSRNWCSTWSRTRFYNLAAQSHVRFSFDEPMYTVDVGAKGTMAVLQAARQPGKRKPVRVYQASSSEMFGDVREVPPDRGDPLLSAEPLRLCQGLCLPPDSELPGSVQPLRLQRHLV